METGVYTFKVHPSASKPEIRDAVESIWGVEVYSVNTLNRGQASTHPRHQPHGSKPDVKHAIVTLRGRDPAVRELRDRHGHSHTQTNQPRSPLPDRLRLRRDHGQAPGEVAARSQAEVRRAQRPRPDDVRHRGGGHKQQYRIIDFKRNKDGVTAKVAAIEYDPNRTCRSPCCTTPTAEGLHPRSRGLDVGDHVMSGQGADIKPGNALPMRYIPVGTTVHNVELRPGQGGKIGRSAGIAVQLVAKDGDFATLRMPSTEMRRADRLPGHRRRGRQRRARGSSRSARPVATAGRASARRPAAWR